MSTIVKNWDVAPRVSSSLLRQFKDINPIVAQILYNRGFESGQKALHFITSHQFDPQPFIMKDMTKAVGRIRQAIKANEQIVVYGDFDADGVTSTTLLMQVLRALAVACKKNPDTIQPYIPNRVDEGYGLNTPALLELAHKGVKLVVTVDCGIRSVQEVDDGNQAGLELVITDHHSVGAEIPNAFAVVNPQQEDCGGHEIYGNLAGCGVAYMLSVGLLMAQRHEFGVKGLPNIRQSDLLDLVAIGTVADIMPLNDPLNRLLVTHGLRTINEGRRLGVRVLAEVAGLKVGQISAQDIGFGFGPRINAAGRLSNAMIAYRLLSATDEKEAKRAAEELQQLNRKRQDLTRESQARIRTAIEVNGANREHLIFAQDDHVLAGIVGLVAGRITEEYYRPTVILEHGEVESRASCRSIPQFHITHALDKCADLLLRHGGHAMAAGFTVPNENLLLLKGRLIDIANKELSGQTLAPMLKVDMELKMRQLTVQLAEDIKILEPTGHRNPPPLFLTPKLDVVEAKHVGGDKAHLKLKLKGDGQPPIDAIAFGFGDWLDDLPSRLDIVYYLEINEWQGRRNLQLRIEDMRSAEG